MRICYDVHGEIELGKDWTTQSSTLGSCRNGQGIFVYLSVWSIWSIWYFFVDLIDLVNLVDLVDLVYLVGLVDLVNFRKAYILKKKGYSE